MMRALMVGFVVGVLSCANMYASDPAAIVKRGSFTERAPDIFRARVDSSKGPFVIEVHRDWAPLGTDRFYNLVKTHKRF